MACERAIWCPSCEYRPKAEDRWQCTPSCGTVWNTFWTRGVCPGCGVTWPKTQCLACHVFSPHEDWYHDREPGQGATQPAGAERAA